MATQVTGSHFSWMDYSERERRDALDVIDLFSEQDTRDELGIGTVRDAFADLLFPGTTTIQTRARYFLFVPWICTELERLMVPSRQMAARARREEITLIDALASSDDPDGTIGIDARASLMRLPSNVYWLGLRRWGIRLFPGSQDQYNRSLDGFHASDPRFSRSRRNDEGEPVDGISTRNWHAAIPARPADFPRQASFRLTEAEPRANRPRASRLNQTSDREDNSSGLPAGGPRGRSVRWGISNQTSGDLQTRHWAANRLNPT